MKLNVTSKIQKLNLEERLAFGWAYIAATSSGELVFCKDGRFIEPDRLERAAYDYVKAYRECGEMHEKSGVGVLIESIVFTPEKCKSMGVPAGIMPACGWWVGFHITDDNVWERIKSGVYPQFSIECDNFRFEEFNLPDGREVCRIY